MSGPGHAMKPATHFFPALPVLPALPTRPTRPAAPARPAAVSAAAMAGLLLLAALPFPAGAQAIRGRALEVGTGSPVEGAEVVTLDSLGAARSVAITDTAGAFYLQLPGPGLYRLEVTHLAYDTTVTEPLEVKGLELLEVEVRLGQRAIGLEPLRVVARRRPAAQHLERYYERLEQHEKTGRGVFITREDIERLGPRTAGAAVDLYVRGTFIDPRARNPAELECLPSVYWNGLKIDDAWNRERGNGAEIPLISLEGIEAYYAYKDELPPEYINEPCGVILLWSRVLGPGEGHGMSPWRMAAFVSIALGFALLAF